ncbi:MAG: hypothetical protein ABL903_19700 [Methylococcales bacterium]
MLKSYEAIYDHGQIQWLGIAPTFKRARVVLVADDENELEALTETGLVAEKQSNGVRLVSILRTTPSELLASIAEKYGEPVEWQLEQRKDRVLPVCIKSF